MRGLSLLTSLIGKTEAIAARNVHALITLLFSLIVSACLPRAVEAETDSDAESLRFFESKIRPVLVKHCYECHSITATELQGGLRLDTREGVRAGGDTGPAVVPRDTSKSLLLSAIRHEGIQMPPDRRLADEVIRDVERWIQMGATDPRDGPATLPGTMDLRKAQKYWAFQPVRTHALPEVFNQHWSTSAIDFFVLAKLESQGLAPAAPAGKSDLCRRIYYDLHGLPPTPEQLQSFVSDESPDAYDRLVDELLASPRYGERWGQHWLDVVRYAETEGFEYDRTVPGAWRYRDYVIDSFNRGKPVDQFVREQIAGDEGDSGDHQLLIAAGLHRLGTVRRNAGNQEVAGSRTEVLTERPDIVGAAMLGLTIGCARCHNHKFDPISQKDYYRLQAFFAASQETEVFMVSEEARANWESKSKPIQTRIDQLKQQLSKQTPEEQEKTRLLLAELENQLPPPLPSISSVNNNFENETPIHILRRGEHSLPGERVTAGVPAFLGALATDDAPHNAPEQAIDSKYQQAIDRNKPRTAMAMWLTQPTHPLTARVFANRIWLNHFGRGIVATANDFGMNGQQPSHPELLDYLADFLVKNQWQTKQLHRLILRSSAYRQSSQPSSLGLAQTVDPGNTLLWHFPIRRLSAEEIRDSMLVISGQLNSAVGGPSVILPVNKELVAQLYKTSQWEVTRELDQRMKRSVYLFAKRNLRLPFMEVFDQPTLQTSCSNRLQSTHAPQALELLNGTTENEMAEAFAQRLMREVGSDLSKQVDHAYSIALSRSPTKIERDLAVAFLEQGSTREFALAILNLNAFLYVR
ncbi:MAG: PSD1 and planctomycete cytochrome C domain-containing protein [Pirellula sp.]